MQQAPNSLPVRPTRHDRGNHSIHLGAAAALQRLGILAPADDGGAIGLFFNIKDNFLNRLPSLGLQAFVIDDDKQTVFRSRD